MSAEIIAFPQAPRSCFGCGNGAHTLGNTHCLVYDEDILDETSAAADCPSYEPADD